MLMEEDIRDISSNSNLLEELKELTIGAKNGDQKLYRSNPVFDPERLSSKVSRNCNRNRYFIDKSILFLVRNSTEYTTDQGYRSWRKSRHCLTIHKRFEIIGK